MKKTTKMMVIFCVTVSILTACGNPMKKMDKNTVYLKKDSTVESLSIEDFDKPYYKEEELKSFIDEEVKSQQEARGEESVSVSEFKVEDKKVTLDLKYQSVEDYVQFTDTILETGTYNEQVFQDSFTFIDADSKEEVVDSIKEDGELQYVKIKDPEEIQVLVDGDVLYYSKNIELVKKNLVKVPAGTESVILYKQKG